MAPDRIAATIAGVIRAEALRNPVATAHLMSISAGVALDPADVTAVLEALVTELER